MQNEQNIYERLRQKRLAHKKEMIALQIESRRKMERAEQFKIEL